MRHFLVCPSDYSKIISGMILAREEKVGAALIQKGDLFASSGSTQDLSTVSVIDMTAIMMGTVLTFWKVNTRYPIQRASRRSGIASPKRIRANQAGVGMSLNRHFGYVFNASIPTSVEPMAVGGDRS